MSIDYSFWDDFQALTINEVAYLWCELPPQEGVRHEGTILDYLLPADNTQPPVLANNQREVYPSSVGRISTMLREALERDEFRGGFEDGRGEALDDWRAVYIDELRLSRNALRDWAERQGMRPKFLFPEERRNQGAGDRKLNNVRKAFGLAVYALVIEKAKGNNTLGPQQNPTVDLVAKHLITQADELQREGRLPSLDGLGLRNLSGEIKTALELIGVI